MKRKIYLAAPYSSKIPFVKWWRYRKVNKVTAHLISKGYNVFSKGYNVFSPITHSHPLGKHLPKGMNTHEIWMKIDYEWIDVCDELWVLCLKGWQKSRGVEAELDYCVEKEKPIRYLEPNGKVFKYTGGAGRPY